MSHWPNRCEPPNFNAMNFNAMNFDEIIFNAMFFNAMISANGVSIDVEKESSKRNGSRRVAIREQIYSG
jgi:hypothetical protein